MTISHPHSISASTTAAALGTGDVRWLAAAGVAALVLFSGSTAQAQTTAADPAPGQTLDIVLARGGGPDIDFPPTLMTLPMAPGMIGGAMDFSAMTFAFGGETVTSAPYSAEAVTEVIQTLADGNRIVRRSSAAVYRDSAGRTRREQGLAVLGPMVGGPDQRQVHITDPEAGVNYSLDMEARTAYKMPVPRIAFDAIHTPAHAMASTFQIELPPPPRGGAAGDVIFQRRIMTAAQQAPVVEQLGTQLIEGLVAEGIRSTTTIPAGAIGNEQPISIVSERWTSPELKVLVQSRQADPRFGETVYRLENVVCAEPPADLLRVPPDFKVVEPEIPEGRLIEGTKVSPSAPRSR